MNDIELIKAEIERLKKWSESSKKEWIDEGYNQNAFAEDCRIKSFDKLLAFIDSLPEETCKYSLQVPKTCEENTDSLTSLKDAAEKYSDKYCSDWAYRLEYEDAFIAGAKWQANQLLEGYDGQCKLFKEEEK